MIKRLITAVGMILISSNCFAYSDDELIKALKKVDIIYFSDIALLMEKIPRRLTRQMKK